MIDWELRNCPFLNRSWVHLLLVLVTPAIEALSLLRVSAPVNAPKRSTSLDIQARHRGHNGKAQNRGFLQYRCR